MKSYSAAVALAGFVSSVAAHGFISSPAPRLPGDGLKAACGDQVYNQQNSDRYGNVQGALQNLQGSHPDCRMWQCKGVPFQDATEVHSFTAGQVIPMVVEIRAPHDGVANVSIVKTSTDTVIGSPLISWGEYALTSSPMAAHPDWTNFDITMPDVSSECATGGDCVIQWYWDAPSISQTYESCIDFSMGGGSGSDSPAPVSSSAAASSAAATAAPTRTAAASATSTVTKDAATPTATAGSGSALPEEFSIKQFISWLQANGSGLPANFTVEQFISWLETSAGSSVASKLRRMMSAGAFRV